MAIVERYMAGVSVGTSSRRTVATAVGVGRTDALAYFAAADQAAREATDVGLLLDSFIDMTEASGTNTYKEYYMHGSYLNDSFVYPSENADQYGSKKIKVTYQTTNAGLPVVESIYISNYQQDINMESDGVTVKIDDGASVVVENYIAQLVATGISSYQTAITAVLSMTVNEE